MKSKVKKFKSLSKSSKTKKHSSTKRSPKDTKLLIAAQEIKFARYLAGNNKKLRGLALKKLAKWFVYRSQSSTPFTDENFMHLWKGLFLYMWMSDKPLVQEDDAEKIAQLMHNLDATSGVIFFKCFLQTMLNEWFGVDTFRTDKFLMLSRRILRQTFITLKKNAWNVTLLKQFNACISDLITNDDHRSLSFKLHVVEIYMEELSKVSREKLNEKRLIQLLRPFAARLAHLNEGRLRQCIVKNIFEHLIKQSDSGIEYAEKFQMWKTIGCPAIDLNRVKKASEQKRVIDEDYLDWEVETINETDDEKASKLDETAPTPKKKMKRVEESDMPLDPRAGKVDVMLPVINFKPRDVVELLEGFQADMLVANSAIRKCFRRLVAMFTSLDDGVYPLVRKTDYFEPDRRYFEQTSVHKAAERLLAYEEKERAEKRKLTKTQKKKIELTGALGDEEDEKENDSEMESPARKKVKKEKVAVKKEKVVDKTKKKRKSADKPKKLVDNLFAKKTKTKMDVKPKTKTFKDKKEKKAKKTDDEYDKFDKPFIAKLFDTINVKDKAVTRHSASAKTYTPFTSVQLPAYSNVSPKKSPKKSPAQEKRVKFAMDKIEKQERSEYIKLVKSSPLPYDGSKQPKKPLLKRNILNVGSPINPFYNLKAK